MFRKLKIQMTLFSSVITCSILILMALICLLVSEAGIPEVIGMYKQWSWKKNISGFALMLGAGCVVSSAGCGQN